ncbi:hypothetical protein EV359DRAFT_63458 [Lentinula novae-zelandiae]|nr:hypothetical protein EV359DRAFT_63458 [Lentinula novae-zelandiae]
MQFRRLCTPISYNCNFQVPRFFLTLPSKFHFPELVSGFLFLMLATITFSSSILFSTILSLIVNTSAIPVDNTRIYGRNLTTFNSNDTQYILRRDASHTTTALTAYVQHLQLVVRPKLKLDKDTVILGYMTYVKQRNADEYNKMRTLTTIPVVGLTVHPLGQGAYLEPIMLMSPTDDFDKCSFANSHWRRYPKWLFVLEQHARQSFIPTLLNIYRMKAPLLFYKTPGYVKAVIPFEYLKKSPQDKEGTISSTENPLGIVTVCGPAGFNRKSCRKLSSPRRSRTLSTNTSRLNNFKKPGHEVGRMQEISNAGADGLRKFVSHNEGVNSGDAT